MSKIKICGLKRIEDIQYANELKPDYVGFVFAGTKRKIDYDTAKELRSHLDDGIKVVGVFVNEKISFISKLISAKIIDCVQLHGDEDERYIEELKKTVKAPIIKAVRVQTESDIRKAGKLDVDYLLLDAYSKDEYGGSGHGFDKSLIPDDIDDYFIAGGIDRTNIKDIILTYQPYCVDVSSGVETEGFKNKELMKEVISIVRNLGGDDE